jgi:hypothetical protein
MYTQRNKRRNEDIEENRKKQMPSDGTNKTKRNGVTRVR